MLHVSGICITASHLGLVVKIISSSELQSYYLLRQGGYYTYHRSNPISSKNVYNFCTLFAITSDYFAEHH